MLTWPPVPTGTLTRLGRVSPAAQLRLETTARVAPAGQTVRAPDVDVLATVTLRTTPVAVSGTPVVPPATVRLRDVFVVSVPPVTRVSRIRCGVCDVYAEPVAAATGNTETVVTTISPARIPANEKTRTKRWARRAPRNLTIEFCPLSDVVERLLRPQRA